MNNGTGKTLQARQVIPFNRGWRFAKGEYESAERPHFDDSSWRELDVPHDWSIEEEIDPGMENGGMQGYFPRRTVAWYRNRFRWKPEWQGKKITIQFDGVHNYSEVWINGERLGLRPYGYASFEYDLTHHLVETTNLIAVKVDNTSPLMDRWYSGSGIYRHVRLIVTEKLHVETWGTYVTSSAVSAREAIVHVQTKLRNDDLSELNCTVLAEILDPEGQVVAQDRSSATLDGMSGGSVVHTLAVPAPKRWSPDSPERYTVYTSIYREGSLVDDFVTPFGIRELHFDPGKGLFLNGVSVKLKGVCIHHDLGCLGAAFHEQAMERRLRVLKQTGCNAIRFSHNPMAPELLDLCDRLGFMVINEAFDKWKSLSYEPIFDTWWKADLEAMVLRDRNHPCVIIWSVGNEVENQGQPDMLERLGMLADYCRKLDPTRPVTCAFEPHNHPKELSDGPIEDKVEAMKKLAAKVDILALNYQEQWYEHYREAIPNQLIVGSETYPYFRGRGNRAFGFEPANPWFDVERHDYVIGQFVWPGIDYLGETGFPFKGWHAGFIDTCGFRKPSSYFHQSVWTSEPMVHLAVFDDSLDTSIPSRWSAHWYWPKLASHWNFPDHDIRLVQVAAFTNCDSAELVINGESYGEREPKNFPNRIVTWYVPYSPGTIEVVARNNGEVQAVHQLRTAGEASRIEIRLDRSEISANGRDLVHAEVTFVDMDGIPVYGDEREVSFMVHGPGKIVGVDNGNLACHASYKGSSIKTFQGKCLVIVQSTGEPGTIELRATAAGFETAAAISVRMGKKIEPEARR